MYLEKMRERRERVRDRERRGELCKWIAFLNC